MNKTSICKMFVLYSDNVCLVFLMVTSLNDLNLLRPSYMCMFTILAAIHDGSSQFDLYCKIGMDKTENSLRIHYDS